MRTENFVKGLLLASIMSFSSIVVADENDTTPKEEQTISLRNDILDGENETLKVPVTATVKNQVLNVQFTGNVPIATVTVNNAQTGATISQQTMTATSGTVSMIPLPELTMGTVTVTNEVSGETVSGEFEVKGNQK